MEQTTTKDDQDVQAYIESMLEDFEKGHPRTAEALRLYDDAMKHYLPAAFSLAKAVFRTTVAHSRRGMRGLEGVRQGEADFSNNGSPL